MSLPAFRAARLVDDKATLAVREIQDAIRGMGKTCPLLDGAWVTAADRNAENVTDDHVALTAAVITKLKHGLERRLLGFLVCDVLDATAAVCVTRVTADGTMTADDTEDLWLKPLGSSLRVRVWVF